MRRLVGISSKTRKSLMAVMALAISLTSIHVAAVARIASLRRPQERLELAAVSTPPSAISQNAFANETSPSNQKQNGEISKQQSLNARMTVQSNSSNNQKVSAPNPAGAPAHKRQIIVSIADRKLALMEDGQVLKTYPIAVGTRHSPSPEGDFVIINRAKDPVYRHGDKEIAPGKDNPLGTRWMGLSMKGYGIHGTNVQGSVGKPASHGCFRMRKQDVEELYTLVQVGDTVTVRRERDVMIAQVFAEPANAPATTLAKSESNAEMQVAAATVAAVEATDE
ncbi:MAG TPA: L,D-transpeptidase [Candidatus Angelobacter sp.]|nr:L,D-transpeptidase [Candidatus Angelobacter sp.]